MRQHPNTTASKKRYRLVGGLALLFLTACAQPLVEAPTPFSPPDTPLSPTIEVVTVESTSEPAQPVETPPEPTEPVELPAQPVLEPRLEPGQPVIIRQISMIDDVFGWGIGEHPDHEASAPIHVLRTADGGQSWVELTPPEGPELMFDIGGSYFAGDLAWIRYTGTDHIWRSTNGGKTWSSTLAGYPMGAATWFAFDDGQYGWMMQEVESGMGSQLVTLFLSEDGGHSWQEVIDPYEVEDLQSCFKTGIAFAGSENGWVTYDCQGNYVEAFLDVSANGGESWEAGHLPPPPGAAETADQGWCYSSSPSLVGGGRGTLIITCVTMEGSTLNESSYLFETEDLGKSWTIKDFPGGEFHRLPDGTMFALARDQYVSRDEGESWTKIKTVNWDGQYSVVDLLNGWAVAVDEDEIALVVTSDGGQTWQIIEPIIASE